MLGIDLTHSLATVTVAAGLLAAAGPASAGTQPSGLITYNGHAGLGAAVYQHNQTDLDGVRDGSSNTIMFVASDGVGAALILMADPGGQFQLGRRP